MKTNLEEKEAGEESILFPFFRAHRAEEFCLTPSNGPTPQPASRLAQAPLLMQIYSFSAA
jgi:hypothetical protein